MSTAKSAIWGILLFISSLTWAQNNPPQVKHYDVVIIGGGISGLATLHRLVQKGITNVLVLESEPRVGGKMWTQRGESPNAPYYERGAELVNTSDVEIIALMKSLGLGLTARRFKQELRNEILMFRERSVAADGTISVGEVRPFTFEELIAKMHEFPSDMAVLKKFSEIQTLRNSTDKLAAKRLTTSLREVTARSMVENGVYTKALFESLMVSEFGVSLSEVSAEVLLDYARVSFEVNSEGKTHFNLEVIPSADEKYRISGGTDSVIQAIEKLFPNNIQKNSKVEKVEQLSATDFRVEVRSSRSAGITEIKADHVVFAVPAYQLPKLNIISPTLSPKRIQDAAALPFGHNAKIFLVFNEKFWNSTYTANSKNFAGVGILESGVQFWETTENQNRTKEGVITLYPGEWPTEEKAQQRKLQEILAELRKVPGLEKLDHHLTKVDVQNWTRSYAGVFNPNYAKAPKLFAEKLPSNMYFVGADKDNNIRGEISESYGYMNGAVRTALRAVDNIMENNQTRSSSVVHGQKLMCSMLFVRAG